MKASCPDGSLSEETLLPLPGLRKYSSNSFLLCPDGFVEPWVQRHQSWQRQSRCLLHMHYYHHLSLNPWRYIWGEILANIGSILSLLHLLFSLLHKILLWRFASHTLKVTLWTCAYSPNSCDQPSWLRFWSCGETTDTSILLLISLSRESEEEKQTRGMVKRAVFT